MAALHLDHAPCALASDLTSVWVTSLRAGVVARINPGTNKLDRRLEVGGQLCGIAVGPDGNLWIADGGRGRVVKVDATDGTALAEIKGIGRQFWDLKYGFNSVWVVERDTQKLYRIDPATASIAAEIPIGPLGSGLAITDAGVLVADETDGTIRRVNPSSNAGTVIATIDGGATWFSDGNGHVALSHTMGGIVSSLELESGSLADLVVGLGQPLDGTVLGDSAFIPDGARKTLEIVDLEAQRTSVFQLPDAIFPFVAEQAFGDAWVLDFGGDVVWRVRGQAST